MTKELILSRGLVTLVDDDVYAWTSQWKWTSFFSGSAFYAARRGPRPRQEVIYLHRVIMDAPKGMDVDHINGDGLDNRRCNLRLATHSENMRNKSMQSNNTSGFKGVSWHKQNKKWTVTISTSGKDVYLGLFGNLEEAAVAYDKAAIEYYGEFARTNYEMGLLNTVKNEKVFD